MTEPSTEDEPQEVHPATPIESEPEPISIAIEKPIAPQGGKRRRIAPKPPLNPLKKGLFFTLFIFIVYTLFGFFVAPILITSSLSSSLENKINRPVTIGSAQVNPFKFDIILKNGIIGAEINNIDDKVDPLLSFGRLELKFKPQAIFVGNSPLEAIHGNSVFLHIVRGKDQQINLQGLITKVAPNEPQNLKQITDRLQLIDIKVTDAKILFADLGSNSTHEIDQISFRFPSENNLNDASYFSASINGSPIKFGKFSGQASNGNQNFSLNLKDINLPSYLNYLPAPFPGLFSKGKADLDIDITTTHTDAGLNINIVGTGVAQDIWINDGKENHNKINSATFSFSSNLLEKKIIFHKLVLESPELHISRNKHGQFFFPAKESFSKGTTVRGLQIDTVVIKSGKLVFIDQSIAGGFGASFNDVNLSIDKNSDKTTSSYALNCITNRKTRIASQGVLTHKNWQTKGLFILNDLPLVALNSYLTDPQKMSVSSGLVDKFETSFILSPQESQKLTSLSKTTASIKNLSLSFQGKEIINIPTIKLSAAEYSQEKQMASLGHMQILNGRFHLRPENPALMPSSGVETKNIIWGIKDLDIQNSMAYLRGFSFQTKPQTIVITKLKATNISSDPKIEAHIDTSLTLLKAATWGATGKLQFNPLRATVESTIKKVSLRNIPAPLLGWMKPPLIDGTLSARGVFTFPEITFSGDTTVKNLKLRYGDQHELLTIKTLELNKGKYTPLQLTLKHAVVTELQTGISISQKKLLNSSDFFTPTEKSLENRTLISIDKISFAKSTLTFNDQQTTPPFTYPIQNITGDITEVNSRGDNETHFSFTGSALEQADITIEGSTLLFADHVKTDLTFTIKDFPLVDIKPFVEPITGYGVQGGLFNLDIEYHEDSGTMHGQTKLDIRHFTLTSETKGNNHFPDIVALLTDTDHHIKLTIPLSGDTTDPSYTLQSAYAKKLNELFLATMVSPYSALGDYFNEQQNPPSSLYFRPGTSELSSDQNPTLLALQTIIKNRPLLHILIAGVSGSSEDRETLLTQKKAQTEKHSRRQELAAGSAAAKSYGDELINKSPEPVIPILPPKTILITKQELQNLARLRSEEIKRILSEDYGIDPEILHLDNTPTVVPESESGVQGNRVDFILRGTAP